MTPVPFPNRPSRTQALLLHAALDPLEEALAAWEEWRGATEFDAAGHEQFQLLALAARNLPAEALDDEVAGRIRGIRRLTWTRNQLLFRRGGEAISALEAAGIPTLVLKGTALAHLAYRDAGVRPMADVDILVPTDAALHALDVLEAAGWQSPYDDPRARTRIHHSVEVNRAPGGEVDLHWQSLWLPADDASLREASVPVEVGGTATRAPSPADNLLLVCAHGLPWSPVPALRWIADAVILIRESGPTLEWERLLAEARRRRLTGWAGVALRYLYEDFAAEVPEEVIVSLESAPQSGSERAGLRAAMRPDSPWRTYRMARDRHQRLLAMDASGTPRRFRDFAVDFWGVESPAALPVLAVRRLGRAAGARRPRARDSARSAS